MDSLQPGTKILMIRNDFQSGGFPINRHSPVLCYSSENRLFIAYDNYTLKTILNTVDVKKCVGVWPGKRDTDIFRLNPDNYKNMIVPPSDLRDIDHAEEITVFEEKEKFVKVEWLTYDEQGVLLKRASDDKKLHDYIVRAGRKHKTKSA